MTPVLLLVDLQMDFLDEPGLQPAGPALVARATALLEGFRSRSLPVVHVWLTVSRDADQRMPHWRRQGKWACVEGTSGHQPPPSLRPRSGELVVPKTFFSAFEGDLLDPFLRSAEPQAVVVAGLYLHSCIRQTVLDAYQRRYRVWVAEDATGSNDPLHGAISRRYLQERAAQFESVDSLLGRLEADQWSETGPGAGKWTHRSPRASAQTLWEVTIGTRPEAATAAASARQAWQRWRESSPVHRAELLERLADLVGKTGEDLATRMVEEVGKPITQARAEVNRSGALLKDIAGRAGFAQMVSSGADARYRYQPLGVVALISPWNNPLAIPLGKIAPALVFGNTVVWKPAPAGTAVALRLLELFQAAGFPKDVLGLLSGDGSTAQFLAAEEAIDAVSFSGSLAGGYALQELCGRRHIPLQAEMGGNNAAIIWEGADLGDAAARVAEAAFGFAGQRCTANRRAIVAEACFDSFLAHLERATAALVWGDPRDPATQVGPVISVAKCQQVAALVARARAGADTVLVPHARQETSASLARQGSYYPPTIVCMADPDHEIVQEETFGPVLVVQRASSFDQALALCNGVRQGLVAALFSPAKKLQAQFLQEAQAGILKLNRGTADADAQTPFGGWKASGIGPPEHGPSDREFYTRTQAIYHRLD